MFKVMPDKNVTFQIKGAKMNKSGIYVATEGFSDYDDACPVWIAQLGTNSVYYDEFEPGEVLLIADHFELEPIPGIWEDYKDDPRFKLLRDRVGELDAYVCTAIMHDNAFIASVDLRDRDYKGGREISLGELGAFRIGPR